MTGLAVRGHADLPGRLLGIGMPLTILLGMAAGAVLLTERSAPWRSPSSMAPTSARLDVA
jgi:hypothetical protein